MNNELAIRYGQGLFEVAKEKNCVNAFLMEVQELKSVFQREPKLLSVLKATRISKQEKHDFLNRLFKNALQMDVLNFVHLMVDRKRVPYLVDSLEAYETLAYEELKMKVATVYSARPLSANQMEKVKGKLEQDSGYQILLHNEVDESLIAGIKVKIGNQVMDISTQYQIEQLKQKLLKGVRG
ncbi:MULTISPECIES: ATP synthase F1 subunit delta [Terrabacteria group]|uniref:ATP synthase F1 subunit delta n=1 Tax=Bacillati TaxID=1783272 RepID=UPI00193A2000|nr:MULTISPECIES: ATP synthase F1 subunit delta [Terrabacteria group]MBW9212481.1 ATP synthase F1 subunit delta [Trueperella sp. zg.1013]QRG86763.1 ATP synthase F1 subunit delta [Bulleidia sp. zg-1006]